jgi:FtsZ-interacting cell division protein ZipA
MDMSLIIDVVEAIAIVISLIMAFYANKKTSGGIEIELYNVIRDARRYLADSARELMPISEKNNTGVLSVDEKALFEATKQKYSSAKEELLNSYEQACSKYLDNKIDKKRFRKNYNEEITNIVKDENFKEYYNGPSASYKATLKVYNEWNNLE